MQHDKVMMVVVFQSQLLDLAAHGVVVAVEQVQQVKQALQVLVEMVESD
jgi:hypothetical protein